MCALRSSAIGFHSRLTNALLNLGGVTQAHTRILGFALILAGASIAQATTFTVANTQDSGTGSLRDAITQANAAGGTNTIEFAIPGTGLHTITSRSFFPSSAFLYLCATAHAIGGASSCGHNSSRYSFCSG
jgi:hypothetical protein